MATFEILEDSAYKPKVGRTKKIKLANEPVHEPVLQKKYLSENRGILQPVNNGVRIKATKPCIKNHIEEVINLVESFKENVEIDKLDDDILKIDVNEYKSELNEEEEEGFSKQLLYVTEYKKDISQYLYKLEHKYILPNANYMLKQSDLTWNTRSILVDWLSSVSEEYRLCNETFHLSVNYIDRFLSNIAVVRSKFQLVGAAAMLLAGKIEEIYPIDVKEWSYLTGDSFTPRQILKMEQLIAKILRFRMQPPTMCTFIEHFCHEHNVDIKTMNLAMYISELVLLEGDEYLNYLPSMLAAASIVLARHTLSKEQVWPKKFKDTSGYTLRELSPLVQKQQRTFKDSPLKDQQAIQTKYKNDKYCKVALLQPRKLALEFLNED